MAELIKIFPDKNPINIIEKVVKLLNKGAVMIYPTDTMYAVGCSIHSKSAVQKICDLKGVSINKNRFAFICNDLSEISQFCKVDNFAFKSLKKYLPGPYTFILPAASKVPSILVQGKKTVGIRIPNYPALLEIIQKLGHPILTTTVPYEDLLVEDFTDPSLMNDLYGHIVDLILDGGIGGFTPSTVIDILDEEYEIIREGAGDIRDFV